MFRVVLLTCARERILEAFREAGPTVSVIEDDKWIVAKTNNCQALDFTFLVLLIRKRRSGCAEWYGFPEGSEVWTGFEAACERWLRVACTATTCLRSRSRFIVRLNLDLDKAEDLLREHGFAEQTLLKPAYGREKWLLRHPLLVVLFPLPTSSGDSRCAIGVEVTRKGWPCDLDPTRTLDELGFLNSVTMPIDCHETNWTYWR
jgi:hypothetical protein